MFTIEDAYAKVFGRKRYVELKRQKETSPNEWGECGYEYDDHSTATQEPDNRVTVAVNNEETSDVVNGYKKVTYTTVTEDKKITSEIENADNEVTSNVEAADNEADSQIDIVGTEADSKIDFADGEVEYNIITIDSEAESNTNNIDNELECKNDVVDKEVESEIITEDTVLTSMIDVDNDDNDEETSMETAENNKELSNIDSYGTDAKFKNVTIENKENFDIYNLEDVSVDTGYYPSNKYCQFWDEGTQIVQGKGLTDESAVIFSEDLGEDSAGLTILEDRKTIKVGKGAQGLYLVLYEVYLMRPSKPLQIQPAAYAVFVNNGKEFVKQENSKFGVEILSNEIGETKRPQLTGHALIRLEEGSLVQLRNIGYTEDHLGNSADGRTVNKASITFIRVAY